MEIQKLRLLSLLVVAASVSALLGGDFPFSLFAIQIGSIVPLWFSIDLVALRKKPFWKFYGLATFLIFGFSLVIRVPLQTAIFFLVLFCLIFEFYGEPRKNSPIRIIGLLSFLLVVHHARVESGLNLFLGLSIYFMVLIWCLLSFHQGRFFHFRPFSILRHHGLALLMHGSLIAIIGMGVFWIIPRLPGQSIASVPSLNGQRISGFSNRVTLSDIGTLKTSRKHVMDVTPLSGRLHSSYLKGRALSRYNDGVWSTAIHSYAYPQPNEQNRFYIRNSDQNRGEVFGYRIDLQPIFGNTIFFFNDLLTLQGNLEPLQVGRELNTISVSKSFPTAFTYTLEAVEEGTFSPRKVNRRVYQQIPRNQSYWRAYADSVLGEDALTGVETARGLRNHLINNFRYTLEINNFGVSDPLYEFLVNRKEGHCELFASSMVLLLRSRNVPARLVTGFLLPDPHPSGFYYVTEADAHAWVEYYANGAWQTIDPTPPTAYTPPTFAETHLAYLRRYWRTLFVAWDFQSQKDALQNVVSFFQKRSFQDFWWLLLLPVGYAFFRWRRGFAGDHTSRLGKLYRNVLGFLENQYRPRESHETVEDYVRNLNLAPNAETAVLVFFRTYFSSRFQHANGATFTEASEKGRLAMQHLRT